ncbi:MAG: hypothetical protein IRY90_10230, partial [Actinomadura rubrobrunea]|nr:hypothetical protein [Actinomadura rubrobrunea]
MPDDPHTSDSTPGPKPKLKADTPEVEALLIWLNNVKDSKGKLPVRALAERLRDYGGPGKTKWAEYLNGTALIPPHYLEMLVRDRVREPGKQEAMIAKGHRLLIKAEQSIAGPLPAKDRKLSQQELYRKLDEAQQTANVASQALWNMTRLTGGLYQLNTSLQQRCARLEAELAATRQQLASAEQQLHTAEHDKLAAEYARLGAEVEALRRRCADLQQQERASAQELEHSRQQLRTAEDNLKAAHRKLEEAEALRLAAVQRAERYRQALLLHSTTPVPHP